MSSSLVGDCDFDSGLEGSIGIDEGFKSLKLNLVIIALMYACWDSENVLLTRLRVILMLRSQLAAPCR